MTKEILGNSGALKAHKEESQRQTRRELDLALGRLRNGNPRRVKQGAAISVASVAEEAGVERSTLYRFHEPILTEIRKLNGASSKRQLKEKRGELAVAQNNAREYRALLEEARTEMVAWARQNYVLAHRVQELEKQIQQRDVTIADLQTRIQHSKKLVPFRAVDK